MQNFREKISYVFNRTFVSIGEAPTLTIALLQLIAICSFCIFMVSFLKYIEVPKTLDEADMIKGQLMYYEE